MPDDVMDAAAGASANVDVSASSGPTESSGGGGNDDYSDLAGDPRVQKYVSDLHSKALKDIPKEYRDGKRFQELLSHSKRLQEIEGNPHFRAFFAGQQAGGGGQAAQQQQQKAATILEAIQSNLGKRYGLDDNRATFLGDYGDLLVKHVLEQVQSQHIAPIREYLAGQRIESEYGEAAKLPGFQDVLPQIQQVMQQYGNNISFADAYKLVKFDEVRKQAEAAAAAQQAGAATEDEIHEANAEKVRRAKASERPTGHGAGDVNLKKARSRGESVENARRRLAAKGVSITD